MNKEEILAKAEVELKLRGCSELTVRNYLWFINRFLSETDKKIEELEEEDVKAYLARLVDTKARATLSLAASSLRFFFSQVLKKQITVNLPKKEKKLPEVLTKEEVDRIIKAAETEKSELMIRMLYYTGLRVSELVNLKREDIDLEKGICLVKGKGNKERQVFLPKKLKEKLKVFFEKHPDYVYVFSRDKPLTPRNVQKILKRIAKKLEIKKKVTPHKLRHSFATHLLESGVNIRTIQALLGHENLQTTQIYTKVTDELYKKAMEKIEELERV
ncbi:MAG TPA: hypothetical protein ENF67_00105 [Candidatus Pacearchaeota archaeon]|nr:MAG: hypothetical protein B6U82_00200 [Candidatus Pacearchaeota archaeon ex4484_31]HDI02935.1 hypothetical protein [Candidatus Pacearchaeota archaeon]